MQYWHIEEEHRAEGQTHCDCAQRKRKTHAIKWKANQALNLNIYKGGERTATEPKQTPKYPPEIRSKLGSCHSAGRGEGKGQTDLEVIEGKLRNSLEV